MTSEDIGNMSMLLLAGGLILTAANVLYTLYLVRVQQDLMILHEEVLDACQDTRETLAEMAGVEA
jgi:hypothetical protein